MKCITPQLHKNGTLVVFGLQQLDHYDALPASVDNEGSVATEWQLSAEDLSCLLNGGRLRVWLLHTGVHQGLPFTPIVVETINENGTRHTPC
jgi:hypothetical protein